MRWVIVKLALLAIAVTAAAQAFSVLFSWYFQPWFAEGLDGPLALFARRDADGLDGGDAERLGDVSHGARLYNSWLSDSTLC
jgi:hypothetical protein